MGITNQRFANFIGFIKLCLEEKLIQNNGKNSFKIVMIIIPLTSKFVAAFHGLNQPAAWPLPFQLLFSSFRVQHMENGLLGRCQTKDINP